MKPDCGRIKFPHVQKIDFIASDSLDGQFTYDIFVRKLVPFLFL
jgi:hypothetical protein